MVIVVTAGGVVLDEPADFKGFKVVVRGGDEETARAALAGVGRLADRDTAWIRADAVRSMAAGRVPAEWDTEFGAMLDYAATKGWLSADRSEIQAHVEWA